MEQEEVMAVSLSLIAHELGVDPSMLRVIRFRELTSGGLDAYLAENGLTFERYQLGDVE